MSDALLLNAGTPGAINRNTIGSFATPCMSPLRQSALEQFKFNQKQLKRRPTTRRTSWRPRRRPNKTKRDKQIDIKLNGQFQIDNAAFQTANGRPRGNIKCEIERFKRVIKLIIKDWINRIKTYFTIGQVPPKIIVGFNVIKIVPRHLNEIKEYQFLGYLVFREKLYEVFEEPDLGTT